MIKMNVKELIEKLKKRVPDYSVINRKGQYYL